MGGRDVLVLFMVDNTAIPEPSPDDPEDRAEEPVGSVETLRAQQLAMLQELAEIGMQMARAVRDEALAPVEPADEDAPTKPPSRFGSGDLGLVYSRIARAVRQTLALQIRVAEDIEKVRVQGEQRRVAAIRWGMEERQREIRDYVAEAIEAEAVELKKPEREVERLLDDLDERIEAGDYDDSLDDAPIGDIVARICADLGVIPDWDLWDQHDWAIEHLKTRDPGDIGADRWRHLETPGAAPPPDASGPPPDPG
jgi:hypothetical protein